MGPAKGTAGSHLPVASEKLVSSQLTHTQTNINVDTVINKGLNCGEKTYRRDVYNILLKGNIKASSYSRSSFEFTTILICTAVYSSLHK